MQDINWKTCLSLGVSAPQLCSRPSPHSCHWSLKDQGPQKRKLRTGQENKDSICIVVGWWLILCTFHTECENRFKLLDINTFLCGGWMVESGGETNVLSGPNGEVGPGLQSRRDGA